MSKITDVSFLFIIPSFLFFVLIFYWDVGISWIIFTWKNFVGALIHIWSQARSEL